MATAEVEEGPGEPASVEEVPSSWLGYSWYLVGSMGRGTKAVINYLGEKIAYGLGITTPDWQYAIDIYEDMQTEEQEEREAEEKALREQQKEVEARLKEMESGQTR